MVSIILLENGESLLQENGDYLLLERDLIFSSLRSEIYRLGLSYFDSKLISDDAVIKLRKGGIIKI